MKCSRTLSAILISCVILAGCTSPASDSGAPTPVGIGGGPEAPTATLDLEKCWGAAALVPASTDWVRPFLPAGFRPLEIVEGATDITVNLQSCKRVLANDVVGTAAGVAFFGVKAYADFANETDFRLVVFAVYTSDAPTSAAFATLGISTVAAEVLRSRTSGPAGLGVTAWEIRGADFVAKFTAPSGHQEQFGESGSAALWFSGPPHALANVSYQSRVLQSTSLAINFEGASDIKALFGNSEMWTGVQTERTEGHYTYDFTGGF